MRTRAPWTEPFQQFRLQLRDEFWGDLSQWTRLAWQQFLEARSVRARDASLGRAAYERAAARRDSRNGVSERDYGTRVGTVRLRIARTRTRAFLPAGLGRFQRRAPEVALLICEAFVRGLSTRQVGRVVALLTEEPVSAQTVSQLTRDLDRLVRQFHQGPLGGDWRYLFLDGISLRVRRPAGRQRVQLLIAYGVRADGTRQLLAFSRSPGESQAAWEDVRADLYRRGLHGTSLRLVVTDGCPGLAAALQTVYPRVPHQRCWVQKLRNRLARVRRQVRQRWQGAYPQLVRSLERDLPALLAFYQGPRALGKRLRPTNVMERCFVKVRRRTRPMVCFVNVQSVDRILYSIVHRLNLQWAQHPLRALTQAA
jgi:transposase-like protein